MEFKTFIPIPIYDYRVYVIFTESLADTSKILKEKGLLSKDAEMSDDVTGAFTVRFSNESYCYLVFKMNANSNQITHEAYHAVCALFRWVGAKHEEELFAYTLGYLVREIIQDQATAIKKVTKRLDK
jgi:hypothetical protein